MAQTGRFRGLDRCETSRSTRHGASGLNRRVVSTTLIPSIRHKCSSATKLTQYMSGYSHSIVAGGLLETS